jgi:hypothetical protein
MSRYLPIKIDNKDWLINLDGNHWLDTGLPVSKVKTVYGAPDNWNKYFRLYVCQLIKCGNGNIRSTDEYWFNMGKHTDVEFMGEKYRMGGGEYELVRLQNALETELAIAGLENNKD